MSLFLEATTVRSLEEDSKPKSGKIRHGGTIGRAMTPEYCAWVSMRQRCTNPKNPSFKNYGARGIQVCERWGSFENFLVDMGRRPSSQHSIDRKNNDDGYEPFNCQWATKIEQINNRRNCRIIALEETDISLSEFCRRMELNHEVVRSRLNHLKWPLEQALWGR
jgi:hypothetical protein